MREEGLALSRRPSENGTNQTYIIFPINEHAFYLPILTKWMHTIYYVLQNYLDDNPLS